MLLKAARNHYEQWGRECLKGGLDQCGLLSLTLPGTRFTSNAERHITRRNLAQLLLRSYFDGYVYDFALRRGFVSEVDVRGEDERARGVALAFHVAGKYEILVVRSGACPPMVTLSGHCDLVRSDHARPKNGPSGAFRMLPLHLALCFGRHDI